MFFLHLLACVSSTIPAEGPATIGDPSENPGWTYKDVGEASGPVVAQLGDNERIYAWVLDGEVQTMDRHGNADALPSTDAMGVGLAADGLGNVHAVYDDGGVVFYAVRSAAGDWSDPIAVSSSPDSVEPNVAVAPDGEIVVSWSRLEDYRPLIEITRGYNGVFPAATVANANCCEEEEVNFMTGPSLSISPDGRAHIVYEWMGWNSAVVEYLVEVEPGGAFAAPEPIATAAFSPCPSVIADDDGAHVTWLPDYPTDVRYTFVDDGEAMEPYIVYTVPEQTLVMAMAAHDADGERHLVVTEWTGHGTQVLRYLAPGDDHGKILAEGLRITQTPRAGGFTIGPDGTLSIAWERLIEEGTEPRAEIVLGR